MVTQLKYGNTNTFFIKEKDKGLLIDTDWAGTLPLFYKELKGQGVLFRDINYVLATHYHPDHMGLISELMALGVTLVVMDIQKDYIRFSDRFLTRDKRCAYHPIDESTAVYVDCEKSRQFLSDIGIQGEIMHTPGHSDDSISVVLDCGFVIVGDLPPLDLAGAYENNWDLQESWKRILRYKPQKICYSHQDIMEYNWE